MTVPGNRPAVVCLDADVLIYAAAPRHALGRRVRTLFRKNDPYLLCGSTLLLPEVLIKPSRRSSELELDALIGMIARVDLWPANAPICELAVGLGAAYGLTPIDAVHLSTAVEAGADVFLTNNRRDFDPGRIAEIDVVFPDELPT